MEKMPYYAITVRRYNILFRHTEWFHQTQALYNEVLLFYYQLYLETFTDEQPGTQEALRILEKLTEISSRYRTHFRGKRFPSIFEERQLTPPRQQPKVIWQEISRNSLPGLSQNR